VTKILRIADLLMTASQPTTNERAKIEKDNLVSLLLFFPEKKYDLAHTLSIRNQDI